jgi:hypothetical protein
MCATLNELMKLFAQNEYLKLKPLCHEMADGFCLSPSPDKQKIYSLRVLCASVVNSSVWVCLPYETFHLFHRGEAYFSGATPIPLGWPIT